MGTMSFKKIQAKLLTMSSFLTSIGKTITLSEIWLADQNKYMPDDTGVWAVGYGCGKVFEYA